MTGGQGGRHRVRGAVSCAVAALAGFVAWDLLFLRDAAAVGVAPPHPFNVFDVALLLILASLAGLVHGLGSWLFRTCSPMPLALLAGAASTLWLYLPREAAYEATCAPLCTGRQDAYAWVLAFAFASALAGRWWPRSRGMATATAPRGASPGLVAGIAIALVPAAFVAWFAGYQAWYQRVAVRQYAECEAMPEPASLQAMARRFGPVRGHYRIDAGDQSGFDSYAFDPSPQYVLAFSDGIEATIDPANDREVIVDCGEGW